MTYEHIDRLMGCSCEENVTVVSTALTYDDDGVARLITTFACNGCDRRVRTYSRIIEVLDIEEHVIRRVTDITENGAS